MADYVLGTPGSEPAAATVTTRHFGVNVVTIYDQEIAEAGGVLQTLVSELGAQTLRFPGGTATELYFDMTNPDSAESAVPDAPPLTPMDQFMAAAGRIGADVALAVPTRVAFAEPAFQAMLAGTYGSRTALDPTYLDTVEAFVRGAIADALAAGTRITTLEIGNEFWASGQMTAVEYGHVAGQVAVRLQSVLNDLGLVDVEIVAQATSFASKIFSPREAIKVFVTADGAVHAVPPAEPLQTAVVPGQGSAVVQLGALTGAINAVTGAADAIDGAVLHYYLRDGFEGADTGRDFMFDQLDAFDAGLDRTAGSPQLTRHITEWNVAAGNHPDNAGLQQASMMAEAFYEMLTHGVTDAQIWPLSFNAAQSTALTDLGDARLSIAGEMFRLMRESLPGLAPTLDWSVAGRIDIHVYASEGRTALFLSERSGSEQIGIALDAGSMVPGHQYFVTMTSLWDGGAGGSHAAAAPMISEMDGAVATGDILQVSLDAWANLRVEMTLVDGTDNVVQGRGGHDRIFTYGGNDLVHAAGGDDVIDGGAGDDRLWGEDGNDVLIGGAGQDILTGGAGDDLFLFLAGHGADTVTDLDFSSDWLRIDGVDVRSLAEFWIFAGATPSVVGDTLLARFGDGDQIRLETQPVISASASGGRVDGGKSDDIMLGGDANDDLRGQNGRDILLDGDGVDVLRGGNDADIFVLVRDGQMDRITDFMPGVDRIDLRAWNVASFSELSFEVEYNSSGQWKGRGYLHWQDETVRLDKLDQALLGAITADDFIL